ncbi:transposase [Lactococcus cremoris]|nr:transposase [Lactococcus cremoris]
MCKYFEVSRSGYYAWKKLDKPYYKNYDKDLASKILLLFNERKKGYRYITFQLKRRYEITRNPKTVLRYMRILNIKSPIRNMKSEDFLTVFQALSLMIAFATLMILVINTSNKK